MTKVFVDTNVWLRFLLKDRDEYQDCLKLVRAFESGALRPYTSTIVLLEVNYVLNSFYRAGKSESLQAVETLLETRNLVVIEKTYFAEALKLCRETKIRLADCLIATQVPKGVLFCTFDNDFRQFKDFLTIARPADFLNRNGV